VFTSLPCIFAGIFDQDLKAEYSFKFPQLYLMGIRNDKFTTPKFYLTVFDAIYQSAVCFGLPYMIFIGPKLGTDGYDTEGVYEFGTFIAGIAVVVANVLVGFTIFSWTWIMFLCIFISCATFFIWTGIYSNIMSFTFYGENILFHQGNFWLCLILTFAICLIPRFATKYFLHMYRPFDNDIVRELVLCNAYSPSSHFLRKKDRYTDDEMEESLPINLSRTRSVVSSDQQSQIQMNDIDTEGRHVLYRSTTQQSTKSEIMNMRTGKRASFMGFAYSTDDNNVFDEYRQSVYRTHIGSTPNLAHRQSIVSLNNDDTGDWMPIDGFKLRHYETDPSILSSGKKSTSLGKKLVKAMKNRMSHRPNNLLDESDNMLVPVTPPTDIQPLQPFLLHQHNESSHHEPSHQPHSPHY
jgi:phospholipid-translocating ATPase